MMLDSAQQQGQEGSIPVYEGIVDSKGQDKVDQLLLHLIVALLAGGGLALLLSPEVERVYCLAIHRVCCMCGVSFVLPCMQLSP